MGKATKHWGIVGGGMLGLYLAHRLASEGQRVTIMEAATEVGGLASAWKVGPATWDKFYHVILLSDTTLGSLLKELGLGGEMQWVETKTGFYTDGRLHSMSNSLEFLKFPPLSLIDKFRLGFTIFYASKIKDWQRLEGIHVAEWLRKWSGKNTFEKIWLPLLRAKLGESYQHTSAAFIWATIQRMYAARRTGLKKEMFGYVKGGYARILQAFSEHLQARGVEIKLGFRASRVFRDAEGSVAVEGQGGNPCHFDELVLAVPSALAARICEGLSEEEKKKHQQIEYLGVVCASVLLKKSLSPFYVTNITDPTPFTGIIEMTNMVDPAFFGGHSLLYLPKYVKASDPIFKWTDQEIQDHFWTALRAMYDYIDDSDLVSFQVARAPQVFALSTLKYSERLPPVPTSIEGVHILNSAHIVNGTLNVNETLQVVDRELGAMLQKASQPKTQTAL